VPQRAQSRKRVEAVGVLGVGYMGSILHVPLWASAQLTTLVFGDFWNRKRDLVAFYLEKV